MLPLLEIVTTTSSTELGVWEFWESTAQTLITGENKKGTLFVLSKRFVKKTSFELK